MKTIITLLTIALALTTVASHAEPAKPQYETTWRFYADTCDEATGRCYLRQDLSKFQDIKSWVDIPDYAEKQGWTCIREPVTIEDGMSVGAFDCIDTINKTARGFSAKCSLTQPDKDFNSINMHFASGDDKAILLLMAACETKQVNSQGRRH